MSDKEFYIKTNSKQHHAAILGALYALGFQWHRQVSYSLYINSPTIINDIQSRWYHGYPIIRVAMKSKDIAGMSDNNYEVYTLSTLDDVIAELNVLENITVVLNGDYTAIVNPDKTVKVGCQTFTFESVKELATAVYKMEKELSKNT